MMLVLLGRPAPASGSDRLAQPLIEIWKGKRKMVLYDGKHVVRRFKISLGLGSEGGAKRFRGDNRTPEGRYYVSDKNPGSRFHRFLGLSYPNVEDAERGYASNLIDPEEWADIFIANLKHEPPTYRTSLGGRVGIHGHGGRPEIGVDWTEGCVAVSDEEIEYLFEVIDIGTPVVIRE